MVLGIVGGYCAGKSTMTQYLQGKGWSVVDLDILGHQALQVKRDQIIDCFGDGMLDSNHQIDRRALGSIVFADSKELLRLESLVHPWMREECKRIVEEEIARGNRVILDSALLFHMGLHTLCNRIILVEAPFCVRLIRGVRRDGLSLKESLKRVKKASQTIPKGVKKMENLYTISGRKSVLTEWERIKPNIESTEGE